MLLIEANYILGVNASTPYEEVKRIYRSGLLRWHPDKNGNSEESSQKFRELQEAWEVYTKFNQVESNVDSDISNLFKDFLNNAWREWGPQQRTEEQVNKTIKVEVSLNVKQILYPTDIPISYTKRVRCKCCKPTAKFCKECKGTGWKGCPSCNGQGFVYCGKCSIGWCTQQKEYLWNTKNLSTKQYSQGPYENKRRGLEIWWKPSDTHWYLKEHRLYIEITIDLLDSLIGIDTNKNIEGKSYNITSRGRTIQKGWGLSYKNTMFPQGPERIIWFVKRINYPNKLNPRTRQWLKTNGL